MSQLMTSTYFCSGGESVSPWQVFTSGSSVCNERSTAEQSGHLRPLFSTRTLWGSDSTRRTNPKTLKQSFTHLCDSVDSTRLRSSAINVVRQVPACHFLGRLASIAGRSVGQPVSHGRIDHHHRSSRHGQQGIGHTAL